MSRGRLQVAAETLKLERLVGVEEGAFGFLDDCDPDDIRRVREGATDLLFEAGGSTFARLGAAAKLIPSPLVASISERSFGPLLCARAAGSVDPAKAIDVAKRLSPGFLADATVELDPRRVVDIISGVPVRLVEPVARELGDRGEHVTMGRFLAFVSDEAIVAAMGALSDEAMLRTAFVLEHKDALDHAVGLLPPERMPDVLRCASRLGLWPQALDLLDHLSDGKRGEIADVIATLDADSVRRLVEAVDEQDLWGSLLPVVDVMSPHGRRELAAHPAFHAPEILRSIVEAAALDGYWVELVPLIDALPSDAVALLPPIVSGLDHATLEAMLRQAVANADTLIPLAHLLADLDERGQQSVIDVVDGADRDLGELLVAGLTDPDHVRVLLDHVPGAVLAAVERAADRVGLRAEYDAAVTTG